MSNFHCHRKIKPITVRLPNGSIVTTDIVGTIIISSSLYLLDVLYIPSFSFNLISVSKLISTLHCQVTFSSSSCKIQDQCTLKTIGVAEHRDGLYIVQSNTAGPGCKNKSSSYELAQISGNCLGVEKSTHSVNTHLDSSSILWHNRLGHTSYAKLHVIKKSCPYIVCTDINKYCETCHMARQKCLPLSDSHTKSHRLFDMIHVDIWGPFSIPTASGHHYFFNHC